MFTSLTDTIQRIHPLDQKLLELLYQKVELLEYPARYKIINEGVIPNKIYLVEKGALRSYYLKDGHEITTWFTFENEFITSFYSVLTNSPSREIVELLEDSVLYGLSFLELDKLTQKYPEINQLYRKVLELNFIKQEKKLGEHFGSASERYEDLISKYPEILKRVPLGYVASYLGITQSTLSRIRKKANTHLIPFSFFDKRQMAFCLLSNNHILYI